nr:hypothetical protein [Tanacetum cinerariifolium]
MTTVTVTTPNVYPTCVTKEKVVEPSLFGVGSSSVGGTDPGVFSDLIGSDFRVGAIHTVINPDIDLQKFFASVREMEHDQLFTEFNVGASRQMSLSAEVKVRVKEKRKLKSVVESQEAEEAIRLHSEASNFESLEKSLQDESSTLREHNVILEKERDALDVKATKLETSAMSKERQVTDLNALVTSINSQNDSLLGQEKVTVYGNYMEQLEKFQDDQMKILEDKFDKLYTNFVEMALHLKEQFYPHLLTTLAACGFLPTAIGKANEKGMQDGLPVEITHEKEGRVLTDVAAHNPFTKADYISALQQLRNVNFPLFAELKSNKDASVEAIIKILCLEDLVAEKLGLNELQPNIDQMMVPIRSSPNKVVIGATALSLAWMLLPFSTSSLTGVEGTSGTVPTTATTTTLSTTLASTSTINPIFIDDYEFVDADDQAVAGEDDASFPNVDDSELHIF